MLDLLSIGVCANIPPLFVGARTNWLTGRSGRTAFFALSVAAIVAVALVVHGDMPFGIWILRLSVVPIQWGIVILLRDQFIRLMGHAPRDLHILRERSLQRVTYRAASPLASD